MKDIGQLTTCENSIDSAVPSAKRKIRTLVILRRRASVELVLVAAVCESEGIGQEAGDSYIYHANNVEKPTVASVNNDRYLCTDPDSLSLITIV